jgi:hypothetical protein
MGISMNKKLLSPVELETALASCSIYSTGYPGWATLAGNYYIDVPGVLRLQHTGNAPVHKRPSLAVNLSTREAGRVIRALLLPEHAGMRWTQRHLAQHFAELPKPIPEPRVPGSHLRSGVSPLRGRT